MTTQAIATTEPQQKMMLLEYMADKYSLKPDEFAKTVRATCGLPTATPEQFAAFLIVAKEYNLNPLTKEIYAFPGRGGIVPIVSIDGWVNLVNSHKACDGFEFEVEHDEDGKLVSCTCKMYRKDRSHPVTVTEYLSECKRSTDPWKMENRMLRHKALIQAARYAFGFSGIYDDDEGEKIAQADTPRDAGPPKAAVIADVTEGDVTEMDATGEGQRDDGPPSGATEPAPDKPKRVRASRAKPKDDATAQSAPATETPPAMVPVEGETFGSWSEKYLKGLETSQSPATVYKWIELNRLALDKIAKSDNPGAKPVSVNVRKVAEKLIEKLQPQPAPKAKKAAEPDITEVPSPDNPEQVLAWVDAVLSAVENPDDLVDVYTLKCEPVIDKMMPPDRDESLAVYRKHEKRLGIE